MADGAGEKLSQQPPATTGTESDFYYIVQAGQTRQQTRAQLRTAVASGWSSVVQTFLAAVDAAAARLALGLTLTLTNFDVTPGRVLKVGDFGIGGVAPALPNNDLNAQTASSEFTINTSTVNRPPAGDGLGVGLHIERGSNQVAAQLIFERNGVMFLRTRTGDASTGTYQTDRVAMGGANGSITSMTALTTITSQLSLSLPSRVAQYTLTTLPSTGSYTGCEIDVTNATGGPKRCRSDGTSWKILNTTTSVT